MINQSAEDDYYNTCQKRHNDEYIESLEKKVKKYKALLKKYETLLPQPAKYFKTQEGFITPEALADLMITKLGKEIVQKDFIIKKLGDIIAYYRRKD